MPSVKIQKKSTVTDMTPFVDVAFLILTFFIMATKFKPPEPVEITTPSSVSSAKLQEDDVVLITMDKNNKVYFSASVASPQDQGIIDDIIQTANKEQNLNLSPEEMANFRKTFSIGVPFNQVKSLLATPADQQKNLAQPGIPVDTTGGQLTYWIQYAKQAFAGKRLNYLIKGDNNAKFPTFDNVIAALKRNDQFKYNLITSPEEAPAGTELYKERHSDKKTSK
ncbi:MAG TPA: biopolymer transporter ExbD [Chitinophagaceae bacterium]|nr:biopolymer transporter ExbD [Chitinophagaceae bacterium]